MDESKLIEDLKANNLLAMDELIHRHHAELFRFLKHLCRNTQEAEDLTQQTLLKVIAKIDRYEHRGSFRNWMMGVAYREFTGWRRKRLWLPILKDQPDTSDPFSQIDDAEALLDALSKLSDSTKAAFLLHHVEDVPILEIAEVLGIPEGTVKSRLFNARNQLRNYLAEDQYAQDLV